MHHIHIAKEWIRTDRNAVVEDIQRLGLDDAVAYQMRLIADRQVSGDTRWTSITPEDMRTAMQEIGD